MFLLEALLQLQMAQLETTRILWKQKDLNSLSYEQQSSIILKDLCIFSQNICKNNFVINTILETQFLFGIIFIQKPSWSHIWTIPSSNSKEEELISISNHSNWTVFSRNPTHTNDSSRVIMYINICLSSLYFAFCKDIYNHRDISLVFFVNNNSVFYLMNVYSDLSQLVLKYLKDSEVIFWNLLVIIGDFSIWDILWNPSYLFHSFHSDLLFDIADSFNLSLSEPINWVSTRYSDNNQESNSVLGLIFLWFSSEELDNNYILLEWYLMSDHTPLPITISIFKEHIQTKKQMIVKDSNKEKAFVKELIKAISLIDTSNLSNVNLLKNIVLTLTCFIEKIWKENSKVINIIKHFKSWWDNNCS